MKRAGVQETGALRMPAEWAAHAMTWMAYGATVGAWGEDTVTPFGRDLGRSRIVARQDLVRLAATISRFEPVTMLVNSAADEAEAGRYLDEVVKATQVKDQVGSLLDNSGRIFVGNGGRESDLPPVRTHPLRFLRSPVNDLWTRDTAPVFVLDEAGRSHAVDLHFNGWGQWPLTSGLRGWRKDPRKTANGVHDQPIDRDRTVAGTVADQASVPVVDTWLTMEGGGLEVNGAGLAVATESCIINPNRNPGKSKTDVEAELRRLFGVEHMLWMPGLAGVELTDWHVDFTARFSSPRDLVYAFDENFEPKDQRNQKALAGAIDAVNALPPETRSRLLGSEGATLRTHELPLLDIAEVYASYRRRNVGDLRITERDLEEFTYTTAPGFVGYYEANGCVVMGQFGDAAADRAAFDLVSSLYPDSVTIQITTDGLASGGGTIHCATQQQPQGTSREGAR